MSGNDEFVRVKRRDCLLEYAKEIKMFLRETDDLYIHMLSSLKKAYESCGGKADDFLFRVADKVYSSANKLNQIRPRFVKTIEALNQIYDLLGKYHS